MNAAKPVDCRLYLVTPPTLETAEALADFEPRLTAALEAGDVASVLLRSAALSEAATRQAIEVLRPLAQARDVAFVIEGSPELALETGCDGVHLPADRPSVSAARRSLGDNAIVGAACGASRHQAMLAADAGADYVAFAAAPEELEALLSWWQVTMVVPCVAMAEGALEGAPDLARAGADFLAVGDALWHHPAGPAKATKELLAQLTQG